MQHIKTCLFEAEMSMHALTQATCVCVCVCVCVSPKYSNAYVCLLYKLLYMPYTNCPMTKPCYYSNVVIV